MTTRAAGRASGLPCPTGMSTDPLSTEGAELPQEVIQALRTSGHTVSAEGGQAAGLYRVNGGPALGSWDVIVLAWQLGLLIGSEGIQ